MVSRSHPSPLPQLLTLAACSAVLSIPPSPAAAADASAKPNLVYILCDDLGYGDVHALNPDHGRISTPNLDRLVSQGMSFRDAHSGSSVCTPTRYGILTGRYCWRTHLQTGVLNGEGAPLIAPGRLTVPGLLKRHGYATACIGKWHVGMDMPLLSQPARPGLGWDIDYRGAIRNGPTAVGFDSYFGISASLDMPPFVWIRDDRFTAPAAVSKKFQREGAAAADFEAVDVLSRLTDEAVACIAKQAVAARQGTPFFLYLPYTSPHTPIVPSKEWQGKSGISPYADFVMQTDACVGTVLQAIDQAGIADSTLVMFTSDNGCSPAAKVEDLERQGHFPSADRRGYKSDIWDGGHRIPLICRWPGRVQAGVHSDQLTCLTDLMATCAELLADKLPDDAGEDSVSILPALLGTATAPLREAVVHHSINGCFALRQGPWKLELCPGSGGWSKPHDDAARQEGLPEIQLYDMSADVGEKSNRLAERPEVVQQLTALLECYIAAGRSTPGKEQKNDVEVDLLKKGGKGAKARAKAKNVEDKE